MRLAFLTTLIPVARPDTGFEIANGGILDALRAAGHDVTAFGFLRPGETPADPDRAVVVDAVDIENAVVPPGRKLLWLSTALATGLPVACAKLWLAGRGRLVEAVRARGPFDAIVLNSVMLPGAFPELLTLGPCVLVEHNIEHVSNRHTAGHQTNPVMRWLFAREGRLLERIERRLWDKARFVWTLAEEDRAALGPAFQDKSAILPLVTAAAALAPTGLVEASAAYDIGLIGTWTWAPNFIGLDWFLREVCPLLPGDVTVAVAGRFPAEMPPLPPQVRLVGRVPDADAFLRSCRIVALSSRGGTGVQLKTVETLQLGLPAVATTLSCRGFAQVPPNVTIADTAQDFAQALEARLAVIRVGDRQRHDSAAFLATQRAALAAGLDQGLKAAGAA
ncbi:glycosyltransferase [Bosea sp. PAMC 26642]|uniref:glycosyltransferase n=1 Tax=Bosea sp. (strain PAMC 26642) TaxID=1792307 RepID=UPI00076FE0E3|nr:glycosyltransferase family 4 protein [Bosea sp. PAMC 26642]AMJ62384.1 hypothetical protein AXW83_20630 [Bosea sp. PAMC 26642]